MSGVLIIITLIQFLYYSYIDFVWSDLVGSNKLLLFNFDSNLVCIWLFLFFSLFIQYLFSGILFNPKYFE